MKEKPILFSTEMEKAILEGRKTQTRRVVKPRSHITDVIDNVAYEMTEDDSQPIKCPYGEIGDVLWVREEHYRFGHWEHDNSKQRKSGKQAWKFVPDSNEVRYFDNAPKEFRKGKRHKDPYTPAWHKRLGRFMPKQLCRLKLRITNIRVERLQNISADDIRKEGKPNAAYALDSSCFQWWQSLWQSINGEQSWNDNPWVWVIEFERINP